MINKKIFREYDIRGIVGKDITKDVAVFLGKAFATLLRRMNPDAKKVSVGRDVRISSGMLAQGIINGITSTGVDVYDIGLCTTPCQYFSLYHLDVDGGIMVTGSHNPPEYNGFKLSIGKDTIFGETIQQLMDIILKKDWIETTKIGNVDSYDIVKAYKDEMINRFGYLSSERYKRIKIVVDAGNGTAGLIAPQILESMGCEVITLYCEPDGEFPYHHPDPTVLEYIKDLIKTTKENKADIGVGYDGDSDRIGLIDNTGNIIWGDQIMIILARDILKREQGATIIGDVKCSQTMFDDIKKQGGMPIMWKTGHSLVKDKMKEESALLAGEFSGHIFIADGYFGFDDAIYTTFRIIEIMKTSGLGMNELLSDVPKMYFTPEIRVECPDERKKEVVTTMVGRFNEYKEKGLCPYQIRETYDIDGVRIVFEKGWGLIRSSNTQPVIVMRIEAEDEQSLSGYKEFLEMELEKAMKT